MTAPTRTAWRSQQDITHRERQAVRLRLSAGGWTRVLYRLVCTHCTRQVGQGTVALIDINHTVVLCERCLFGEESWETYGL